MLQLIYLFVTGKSEHADVTYCSMAHPLVLAQGTGDTTRILRHAKASCLRLRDLILSICRCDGF